MKKVLYEVPNKINTISLSEIVKFCQEKGKIISSVNEQKLNKELYEITYNGNEAVSYR